MNCTTKSKQSQIPTKIYKDIEMDKSLHKEGRRVSYTVKRDIVKQINTTACLVYEYYVDKAYAKNYDLFDDEKVANVLGLTARVVQDARLALQRAGFIYFNRIKRGAIETHDYYFGESALVHASNNTNTKK